MLEKKYNKLKDTTSQAVIGAIIVGAIGLSTWSTQYNFSNLNDNIKILNQDVKSVNEKLDKKVDKVDFNDYKKEMQEKLDRKADIEKMNNLCNKYDKSLDLSIENQKRYKAEYLDKKKGHIVYINPKD